jgi:hypothetical protein
MFWTRVGCFQHGGQGAGSNMCQHKNFKGSDSSEASALFLFCAIVLLLFYKTITLWLPCLDGLIQTLGNVVRVNSRNIPACLDQAIQTRKPLSNCILRDCQLSPRFGLGFSRINCREHSK